MKTFLKGLALLAAITSITWIAVIWHWQATHRDMSAEDLVAYLVVLPLVVFALVLGLRWAVRSAMARQAAAASAAGAAPGGLPAAPNGAGAPSAESRERSLAWPLMGAWVLGPAGADVAGLLEAARSGKPGPAPDAALRDGQGLPVMCARAGSIDTSAVDRAWAEWSRGLKDGERPLAPPAHAMRALAALAQVLASAGEKASQWWQGLAEDQRRVARVRVLASWPEAWAEGERTWAQAWLMAQRPALEGDELGAGRWLVQHLPPASGPEAWQHADRLLLALERERSEDLVLLTACHSDLSEPAVDALERANLLFHADRHPKGRMPGEGAAALLLGRSGAPREGAEVDALAWLHRPACIRREKSIDAAGRASPEVAREAASSAMKVAAVETAEVMALCTDAERHSPRATELFGTTVELLPGLDPVEDMRLLGVVQGHAAGTGALWAVAGAATQAREAQRPALALSLADAHWRMALVVRHEPPPASAKAATA